VRAARHETARGGLGINSSLVSAISHFNADKVGISFITARVTILFGACNLLSSILFSAILVRPVLIGLVLCGQRLGLGFGLARFPKPRSPRWH
jgi:hypothetical protein